ncbi:ATP synthase subunit delta [Planctomycetes bacterium Poly30]|uniref:ATP synthase subunit delta n=1 Tax=Saltatorellus ferox TaxID=2528018 RepID=A0A518ERL0_9BACT|nr:ATP synthase subunit delta [Planctomycetes bacterium Poly30]
MSSPVAISNPVTRRWAEALYEVAQKANAVEDIQRDTERLSSEVSSPAVAAFLFGSSVSQEVRLSKFEPLLNELHPKTQSFVRLLFERRRLDVLTGIGQAFKEKVYAETGRVEGICEVVRPLSDEDLSGLEESVGRRLGKTVVLSQRTVPELIGGVRVIVGARLFDASVQGRLEKLRERLMSSPLPS